MTDKITVKQDGRGVWFARPYLGKTPAGRDSKPYKSFPEAQSESEALALAQAWAAGLTHDGLVPSMLLTDLLDDYISMIEAKGASPNSIKAYRLFASNYCARFLKKRRADELTAMDFNRFEVALLKGGGRGGGPLSQNTVIGVYQFLRAAYRYFVKNGLCESNPLVMAEKPSMERHEAISLEECDFTALVHYVSAAMRGDALPIKDRSEIEQRERVCAFAVWMALHTGMRVGEVCALHRRDVAVLRGFVHVGGTVIEQTGHRAERAAKPKTSHSRRNVSMTPEEFNAIAEFTAWQDSAFAWCGSSSPLVSLDGSYMRPTSVSEAFKKLCHRLGIDQAATFHTLRHTHASWCLAAGVDIITLSERLGHADPSITMRVYGHVLSGRDVAAAEAFASIVKRVEGEGKS